MIAQKARQLNVQTPSFSAACESRALPKTIYKIACGFHATLNFRILYSLA